MLAPLVRCIASASRAPRQSPSSRVSGPPCRVGAPLAKEAKEAASGRRRSRWEAEAEPGVEEHARRANAVPSSSAEVLDVEDEPWSGPPTTTADEGTGSPHTFNAGARSGLGGARGGARARVSVCMSPALDGVEDDEEAGTGSGRRPSLPKREGVRVRPHMRQGGVLWLTKVRCKV